MINTLHCKGLNDRNVFMRLNKLVKVGKLLYDPTYLQSEVVAKSETILEFLKSNEAIQSSLLLSAQSNLILPKSVSIV